MPTEVIDTVDDKELFEGALADEPKEAADTPSLKEAKEAVADERPRDDLGRFAPKEAEAAPTQQQEPETTEQPKDDQGQVPSWRLREVREAREAAERRAEAAAQQTYALSAQLQAMRQELTQLRAPKQEPVDFFANPEEALAQRLNPFEQRFAQMESQLRLNSSKALAIAMHGAPAVAEMEKAIEQSMQKNHPEMQSLAAQMRSSDDPVGLAMQWHKRSKLWETTGGDPEAYRQKVLDDALKDPEYLAKALEAARTKAGTNSRPNVQLPPSLNRATGAGVSNALTGDDDNSDAGLFRYAVGSPRR